MHDVLPEEMLTGNKRELLQKMLAGDVAATPRLSYSALKAAPLSFEQRQIWLHAKTVPDLPLYNEPITIYRSGPLDIAALQAALNEVVARHDILRTWFEETDDGVQQRILDDMRVTLHIADVSDLDEASANAAARWIITEDARAPFDLGAAPLFRCRLVKLRSDCHWLHLTLHHIIFDGHSIYKILVPELIAAYERRPPNGAPAAEPPLQYADYAAGQCATADMSDVQLAYWRQELAGAPQELRLPFASSGETGVRGDVESFEVAPDLMDAITRLAATRSATPYMALLAAFKTLLHIYSRQSDLVVGSVVDTRRRSELKRVMGCFLNLLPIRTQPAPAARFIDYVEHVRDKLLDGLAASEIPFERIVQEVQLPRAALNQPLVQAVFGLEPPLGPLPEGWDMSPIDVTVGAAKFDLYMILDQRPTRTIGRLLYNAERFSTAAVQRMTADWLALLRAVVEDPSRTLAELAGTIAPAAPRSSPVPAQPLTPQCLRDQVSRTPNATALTDGKDRLSYAELDERADRLAAHLETFGVGREVLVGICLPRSIDQITTQIAIMRCGGAFLPLDPAQPEQYLRTLLSDAGVSLVVTASAFADKIGRDAWRLLELDRLVDAPPVAPRPHRADVHADDLAYVIYTSGSTGGPKGVEITHGNLINFLQWHRQTFKVTPVDCGAHIASLGFDASIWDVWPYLISGASIAIASEDVRTSPEALQAWFQDANVTIVFVTTALGEALLTLPWPRDTQLRFLLVGGEALQRYPKPGLPFEVVNNYGPTECTVATTSVVLKPRRFWKQPPPIGRPISNVEIHILDAERKPVAAGQIGEIYIGGAGVGRGYRNRAALTAERFVGDPTERGRRLYRTGDLGRRLPDGTVAFHGRVDDQAKIRGYRIEPGEIAAALNLHPDVRTSAVIVCGQKPQEKRLIAYIVAKNPDAPPSASELRRFLAERLPEFMVPTLYVPLKHLPLTHNGKIDRRALPGVERPDAAPVHRAPQTRSEVALAAIWRKLLNVPHVGIDDSFFELGAHSLVVAKLLRKIGQEFGVQLSMAAVFRAETLGRMAALIDGDPVAARSGIMEIQSRGARPPLFWIQAGPLFRPLAEAIGFNQPFLGVSPTAADEAAVADSATLEEIAARLVSTIVQAHPGPYRLGGWCTGGILAYEVARQLAAKGHKVALLVMLHAPNLRHMRKVGTVRIELDKLKYHIAEALSRRSLRYVLDHIYGAMRRFVRLCRRNVVRSRSMFSDVLDRAVINYQPCPYPGDVVMLQPVERPALLDCQPGWVDLIQGHFICRDVPGSHNTMLKPPHVGEIAAAIRPFLETAEAHAPSK